MRENFQALKAELRQTNPDATFGDVGRFAGKKWKTTIKHTDEGKAYEEKAKEGKVKRAEEFAKWEKENPEEAAAMALQTKSAAQEASRKRKRDAAQNDQQSKKGKKHKKEKKEKKDKKTKKEKKQKKHKKRAESDTSDMDEDDDKGKKHDDSSSDDEEEQPPKKRQKKSKKSSKKHESDADAEATESD